MQIERAFEPDVLFEFTYEDVLTERLLEPQQITSNHAVRSRVIIMLRMNFLNGH